MTRSLIVDMATEERPIPAGRVFDVYRFELRIKGFDDAAALQTVRTVDASAQFNGVNDGTYTVTVAALDTAGGAIGAPVSGNVEVGAASVPTMYQAPTGLGCLVV